MAPLTCRENGGAVALRWGSPTETGVDVSRGRGAQQQPCGVPARELRAQGFSLEETGGGGEGDLLLIYGEEGKRRKKGGKGKKEKEKKRK